MDEWLQTHPEDREFAKKLTVSGLPSPLKAEKRAELAEKLAKVAEMRWTRNSMSAEPRSKN